MKNFCDQVTIIGLGYVGLPLLAEIGDKTQVIGFDLDSLRIHELKDGYDRTGELTTNELNRVNAKFTDNFADCGDSDFYVVTVPTPVNSKQDPEPKYLRLACEQIGPSLQPKNTVIFESTVYPGLTREVCIPILERLSGLKCSKDFFVGYSPERINPGDKTKRLKDIIKVTSGCCNSSRRLVDKFYSEIVGLKTHSAPSLEVAEAAKVIENTQRDINIALMNELSEIFNLCGIDTKDVIEAASTKWNFQAYTPGLVGGHCIGVDPYYLAFKARQLGIDPKVILAGRATNEKVVSRVIQRVHQAYSSIPNRTSYSILLLGATFKENCPDIRNSKSIDLYNSLNESEYEVEICDPLANLDEAHPSVKVTDLSYLKTYDLIIATVGHQIFKELGIEHFKSHLKENGEIFDLKSLFSRYESTFRL